MRDPLDRRIVRALCDDLPLSPTPFREIARRLGVEEELLLRRVQRMQETGEMRRIGVALHHVKAGYMHNVMVVWDVPDDETARVGELMASQREVSHCYCRLRQRDWPYNLYTMIHANSEEGVLRAVREIAARTGCSEYRLLSTIRELKKAGMKYYSET